MTFFNVLEYGAQAGGVDATEAVQRAIDACSPSGGVVVVPAGTFHISTIELRTGVTLRLEKGAVLKGSPDLGAYRDLGIVHNEWGPVRTLIFARDSSDIAIDGDGTIDFSGSSFFDFSQPHSRTLDTSGMNSVQLQEFEVRTEGRPNQAIFFLNCSNVTVTGVQLLDSPGWGLCVSSCSDVLITGLRIRFSRRIPNADGIHLVSCRNVRVSDCDIVSGDDCIAITGINDWTRPSENIVIANCVLSSSSAGIRIGYWHSIVRNVLVQNCVIHDSVRGFTVMGCGSGLVENVVVSGVSIQTRGLAGTWWGIGEGIYVSGQEHQARNHPGAEVDPVPKAVNIRNVTFRDVTLESELGMILIGDRKNVADIRVLNARITLRNSANRDFFGNALDLNPGNATREMPADASYWLFAEQISGLLIADTRVHSELEGLVNTAAKALSDSDEVVLRDVVEPGQP
jgi:polygalacturonase